LAQRVSDITLLAQKAKTWEQERNQRQQGINWRFAIANAHIKFQ
jgi:hypothetical protein